MLNLVATTAFVLLSGGCKDESNPIKVQYTGPIALRTNYAKPTLFKIGSRSTKGGALKLKKIECVGLAELPPKSDKGVYECYVMNKIPENVRSAFAEMARFILNKKDPFDLNGKMAGTVVDKPNDKMISLHRNELVLVRDGPDVCMRIIGANIVFVWNNAHVGDATAGNPPTQPGRYPVGSMSFDENFYLYNFVDFTDPDVVYGRLRQFAPQLFMGDDPNPAWAIKASRHLAIRVCKSTIENSVVENDGVVFKVSIN